ncbi:hypothetical protein JHK82_031123 [Glycine max]|nr:hypothetical protein JHK85_031771 [Glycine max]KAG4994395.1 hypothetical protein JHK86_031222 [Glycine max]KAG5124386.1 hypothetical protein JHK82_031123 [Glycine max]
MGENQRTMEKKGEKRVLILLLKLELEELEKVETIGESSTVCKDLISSVESIPDPLLPFTKGSVDAGWDRWFGVPASFRAPSSSNSCHSNPTGTNPSSFNLLRFLLPQIQFWRLSQQQQQQRLFQSFSPSLR